MHQRLIDDTAALTFASVTDANDTIGTELLRRGYVCHGHGGYGELIHDIGSLPPTSTGPGSFPRCDTIAEIASIRTPDILVLQMSTHTRLHELLPIIQPGMTPTVVILIRTDEITMGEGILRDIVDTVKQSGRDMNLYSDTMVLKSLGYPCEGAWTFFFIWRGENTVEVPTKLPGTTGASVLRDHLGKAFGHYVETDQIEMKAGDTAPQHRPVKAGRARIQGSWYTVYSTAGLLPSVGWTEAPPMLWGECIVTLEPLEVARIFDLSAGTSCTAEQLWLAVPGKGAALLVGVLEPLVKNVRAERRRPGPSKPCSSPSTPVHFERAKLEGGKWWCVIPTCSVCKRLTCSITHKSRTRTLAQVFLMMAHCFFIRMLKKDFKKFIEKVDGPDKQDSLAGFFKVLRAYTVNHHGGEYKYKDTSRNGVIWVCKTLRQIIFWRWPPEVSRALLRGFNPGFDYPDLQPYQFEGNYATSRADRKIEATEVKKFVDNEVFEPLDRPKGLAHLLRYAPLFLIPKKQTGDGPTKYRMIADEAANGGNCRPVKLPAYFPSKEFVWEKCLKPNRLLWESDVMDCFHLLPVDKTWRWLVCVFSMAHGALQYATLCMGHTNSVYFCLFVVYWFHTHLRRRGLIERDKRLNTCLLYTSDAADE